MKLSEFINHIKHTSVVKDKINDVEIGKIEPLYTSLNIFIKDGKLNG